MAAKTTDTRPFDGWNEMLENMYRNRRRMRAYISEWDSYFIIIFLSKNTVGNFNIFILNKFPP